MTSRKKPTAGFWITVALVVGLVGYPLSFGPACWWLSAPPSPRRHVPHAPYLYWPIGQLAWRGPPPISKAICWIATRRKKVVCIPTGREDGLVYTAHDPAEN